MEREIILVTGGQRSGKSDYAQRLALQRAENPVYLATSIYNLETTMEHWPQVKFHTTREMTQRF